MNFKTQLHLSASTDELRPSLCYILFVDGYAVATDAHTLVRQKIAAHGFSLEDIAILNNSAIHRDTFAEIRKYKEVKITPDRHIQASKGKVTVKFPLLDLEKGNLIILNRDSDGKPKDTERYPDWQAVIPDEDKECSFNQISMSSKLLSKIEKLTLDPAKQNTFKPTYSAILIYPFNLSEDLSENDELILLMPIIGKKS